ncbi:MAG: tetratricopeptide repeat protein [Bacteroidales bacterium]|nr:tetratricopeptide repeat protein [Bacteroidales bacterium]
MPRPIFHISLVKIFLLVQLFGQLGYSYEDNSKQTGHNGVHVSDTATINHLNLIAYQYRRNNPDTAYYLANLALKYSLELKYKKGIGNAYIALGYTHLINYSRNDSATWYLLRAFDLLNQEKDDFGMGMACFGMGYVFSFKGNLKKSAEYFTNSLRHFMEIEHYRGIYNACNSLAYIYQQTKDFNTSFDYIQDAIRVAGKTGDTSLMAEAYNNLGNIYKDQFLIQQAIDVYFKALALWEQKRDSVGMSIAYGNIGLMYYFQDDFDKALEYYKMKLPVVVKAKNMWEESRTYNDIGYVYLSLDRNDTALVYFQKGLKMNIAMNYPPGTAGSYFNIAKTFHNMQDFDSALAYVGKSIQTAENINDRAKLAGSYILLGKISMDRGNFKDALKYAQTGYRIARELNIPDAISEGAELLSALYAKTGRYELAYNYFNEFKKMQDSLSKDEHVKKITRLELQYEFDKKERIIAYDQEQERAAHKVAMKQQKIFFIAALLFIVFIVLFGILLFRQRVLRVKLKNIDLEQKLLRVQMNPHFIFNSLCAVQEYILSNKPKEANYFLSRFAAMIRSILESSRQDFIPLEEEIEILKNYVEIQRMRFDSDFDFRFSTDEKLDIASIMIPPMMAQPFVENAIEHGLLPAGQKGFLEISYKQSDGLIQIMIEDNGIGRKKSEELKKGNDIKKKSLATILAVERIDYFKQTLNNKSCIQIEDIIEATKCKGTRVTIWLPWKNNDNRKPVVCNLSYLYFCF